jgi:hypothetical protein
MKNGSLPRAVSRKCRFKSDMQTEAAALGMGEI